MLIGERLRELRKAKDLSLRELAEMVGVGFTYLSKIETGKLEEGHSPSEALIHKLALQLDADESELLLLAEKLPQLIKQRLCERPDVFQAVATLNDNEMNDLMIHLKRIAVR